MISVALPRYPGLGLALSQTVAKLLSEKFIHINDDLPLLETTNFYSYNVLCF